jgi:hypothetical protein
MKVQVLAYVMLFLSPIIVCAQGDQMKGNSQVQSQIDALAAKLSNMEIKRIEILQIPPEILTRTRITPEMLEKQFYYKFTISDARGGRYSNKLVELLKSLVVQSRSEMTDIRWGVIFYGVDDIRVGAIYFNKTESSGAVGNVPVSFKGNFFKWLDSNFSNCFR